MRALATILFAIPIPAIADLVSYLDVPAGETAFTVPGGGLELVASAPLSTGSSYLGISGGTNGVAIDDADGLDPADETLRLRFAPGVGLQAMAVKWTRGTVRISGFAADPMGGGGTYDAATGIWRRDQPWTADTTVVYTFANSSASAGRDLELSVGDPLRPSPQVSISWIAYAPVAGAEPVTPLVLDGSNPRQTMHGFGASGYWSLDPIVGWPTELREQVANRLFSEAGGIGLSSFRFDFGGGDTGTGNQTSQPWTWRFPEPMQPDPDGPIDWTARAGQQWFLRRAADYGLAHLTLGANSPPAWATRNGRTFPDASVGTTNLDFAKAAAFASYLCDIVEHFHRQDGIVIDEISPLNEPEWAWEGGGQEGCRYTAADAKVLVEALHDALVARELDARTNILVGDHGSLRSLLDDEVHQQYNGNTFNHLPYGKYREFLADLHADPDLAGKIAPVATYHSYWTDLEADLSSDLRDLFRENCARYGMEPRQTEFCPLRAYGNGRDLSLEPAFRTFQVIHRDLTRARASAWSWWLALSPHDYKDGLLYTNYNWVGKPNPELYDSKILWMLGHFSRFIRPGYRGLAVPAMDDLAGLMASGWISPDHRTMVAVVGNASGQARPVRLEPAVAGAGPVREWTPWTTDAARNMERGAPVTGVHVLAPRSITTFVGRVSPGPFRLRASIEASSAFPAPGTPTHLQARATWEDGLVRIFGADGATALQVDETSEWVLAPLDREPRGRLFPGRYRIAAADGSGSLGVLGNTLVIDAQNSSWRIDRDAQGRSRLRHEDSGRLLAWENGAFALSHDRDGDGQRIRFEPRFPAATFTWADGLGSGSLQTVSPPATRWFQVTAETGGIEAEARILIRVGEPDGWLDGLPTSPLVIRHGESVTLAPRRREDGVRHRFQILPADRDEVLEASLPAGAESPVILAIPGGGANETWEWINAATGSARPWIETDTAGYLRNSATGAHLRPSNGAIAAGTPVVQSQAADALAAWRCEEAGPGRHRLVHQASGRVLGIAAATAGPVLAEDTGAERFYLNGTTGRRAGFLWSHADHSDPTATFQPPTSTTLEVVATSGGVDFAATIPVRVLHDFDSWSQLRFGELVAPGAHHDGDALTAMEEFLHGTDPHRRDAIELVRSVRTAPDGSLEVRIRRNTDADGTWTVQTSPDLRSWRDMGVNEFTTDGPQVLIPVAPADSPGTAYYRLRLTW